MKRFIVVTEMMGSLGIVGRYSIVDTLTTLPVDVRPNDSAREHWDQLAAFLNDLASRP